MACEINVGTGRVIVDAEVPELATFREAVPTLKDAAWAAAQLAKNPEFKAGKLETAAEHQVRLDEYNAKKAAFDAQAKIQRQDGLLRNAQAAIGLYMTDSSSKQKRIADAQAALTKAQAELTLTRTVKGE